MEKQNFNFETFKKSAAERLKQGDSLLRREGVLTPLLKEFLEEALGAELEAHLDEERPNRKNGKGNKLLKTSVGNVEIQTPRDRNGTFEPELAQATANPWSGSRQANIGPICAWSQLRRYQRSLTGDVRAGRIYGYDQPGHRQNPSSCPGMA